MQLSRDNCSGYKVSSIVADKEEIAELISIELSKICTEFIGASSTINSRRSSSGEGHVESRQFTRLSY